MVAGLGPCESKDCWCEEHSFVVRVGYEQANPLVLQCREARGYDSSDVGIESRNNEQRSCRQDEEEVHGALSLEGNGGR